MEGREGGKEGGDDGRGRMREGGRRRWRKEKEGRGEEASE